MNQRLNQCDAGFTLIELLVAVTLLGVVMLALGNAVIGYVRTNDATTDRLLLSHDAQLSSAYFAEDVAAVGLRDYAGTPGAGGTLPFLPSIQTNAAYDAGGVVCGTTGTPVAVVRLLSDDWDAAASPPVRRTNVVAYYLVTAGSVSELHRLRCAGAARSEATVAHYVHPTTVAVTCSSACDAATVPQTVTLRFTVTRPHADPYPIVLSGQRRQT
jgi:prepilin-type N-terminal cleavage/methylation domain-containing protein